MNTRTRVGAFALAGVLLALTAGCGGEDTAEATTPDASEADADIRALLPEDVLDAGTLRVASDVPYPPFEMFDSDGRTIIGADPDLGRALGEVLGIEFEFHVVSFESMIPSLTSGRFDIAMTGMADTPERQSELTFVDYMTNGGAFVVLEESGVVADSMESLCGLAVGAQTATVMADVLTAEKENCPAEAPMELSLFTGQEDAVNALRSGRVDVIVITTGSAGYLVEQTNGEFQVSLTVPGGLLGIAVPTGEDRLAEALQAALQKLIDDGTYEEILAEYGLAEHNSVEEATLNAGA